MALIADLLPYVELDAPGASVPLIRSASINVIKNFLTDSRLWVANIQPFNTEVGLQTYELVQTADTDIVGIRIVRVNGLKLDPTTESDLDAEFYNDWQSMQGLPIQYFSRDGGARLSLFRTPSAVLPVQVKVELTISDTAETYPDFVNTKYRDGLIAGIKASLLVMPNVAWSNPNLALLNEAIYKAAKDKAAVDAFKGTLATRKRTVARFI